MGDWLAGLTGLCAGIVSGTALCAFYIALGVFSKSAVSLGLTTTGKQMAWSSALGGMTGAVITLYDVSLSGFLAGAPVFGMFAGLYVGVFIACLAEVTDFIPVIKNTGLAKAAIKLVLFGFVLGKLAGSLVYWLAGDF